MKIDAVVQPHLGRFTDSYKNEDSMGDKLCLAKVIQVHHKNNTVDIQLVKGREVITSSTHNQGKFGARVLTSTAHYNEVAMSSSGIVTPLQKGQLVVVAFLEGYKKEPIIIGSFHDTTDIRNNVLVEDYPLKPERSLHDHRESLKTLMVTPSQMWSKVDGIGTVEVSMPCKSFFTSDADIEGVLSDGHKQFDHVNLSEVDYYTREVRHGKTEEELFPHKILMVHRSSYMDEETTWTKFFIDADGTLRLTRDNNDDKLLFQEFSEEGEFSLRRQIDSNIHGEGKDFGEVTISKEGTISLGRSTESTLSYVNISDEGITVRNQTDSNEKGSGSVNSEMSMKSDGSVTISKDNMSGSSVEISKDNDITLKHPSGSYIKLSSNGDIIISASGNVSISGSSIHTSPNVCNCP